MEGGWLEEGQWEGTADSSMQHASVPVGRVQQVLAGSFAPNEQVLVLTVEVFSIQK